MARERYLLHEGEETIHREKDEIQLKTPKDKWKNFWYYNKWYFLIGAVVILLAFFLIKDIVVQVKPDYQVMLATRNTVPQETVDALKKTMEKYADDRNGDGKVVVQVNANAFPSETAGGNADVRMASVVHLQADLSDVTSVVFMTDDACFREEQKEFQLFSYTDGTTPAKDAADYDRMRVALKDCKVFSELVKADGSAVLSQLSLSLRVFEGTDQAKNKDKQDYYSASRKLFEKITAK